jgi:molybdopterin-containing oxidoreductase family iron-sulfur binding subunit
MGAAMDESFDVLLLNNVNPVHCLPDGKGIAGLLNDKIVFSVAFSNFMDDTAALADLIIPVRMPLESWDAYESKQAMTATLQPAMGRMTEAPAIGDFFIQMLPGPARPAENYRQYLVERISRRQGIQNQTQWLRMIQSGGHFVADQPVTRPGVVLHGATVRTLAALLEQSAPTTVTEADIRLYVTPSLRYYDGRGANRPWLPEIPETVSQVSWQSVALAPPEVMKHEGWADGDRVELKTGKGGFVAPVVGYAGLHPSVMVIQAGQGHLHYGRYAENRGVNPVPLLNAGTERLSGAPDYSVVLTSYAKSGPRQSLARVSGSRTQHDRRIALSVSLADAGKPSEKGGLAMNDFPLTLPLPQGYDHHRDIYPAHDHEGYRWGMAVDLDRCIGCSACVAACYAENNVGIVGEERIIEGREMAWLRIERYQDPDDPARLIFLPMLCQHCDNAPCESVCPVYAPHHSKEGLNNQIYNRCIGTRFCAQNCPYKVRRFNWFDWQWPEPLNRQLNPNVTVRSKGVMEKCSFCIQRIKQAHDTAKNEKRTIRDGEVIPACAQTCPTDAIVFGDLMDPASAVRRLIDDPRAYQVMGYLNTKPAVIYLKKVTQILV